MPKKMFVSSMGYGSYAVAAKDISTVLAALALLIPVKQVGYSGPYYLNPESPSAMHHLSEHEVVMTVAPVPVEEDA